MNRRQLRSEVLKRAMRAYIVSPVIRKYHVIAVRAMWSSTEKSEDLIWGKRRQIEDILLRNDKIVAFFSCITTMVEKESHKRKRKDTEDDGDNSSMDDNDEERTQYAPGISFWIAFDWPEYGLNAFEDLVCKTFLKSQMNLVACKAIKPRGKS